LVSVEDRRGYEYAARFSTFHRRTAAARAHAIRDSKGEIEPPLWLGLRIAKVEESGGMRQATDDWPFLYTRQPTIPASRRAASR